MTLGTGIRGAIRRLIDKSSFISSTALLYPLSTATATLNDEGERTAVTWGSGTSIRIIPEEEMFETVRDTQGEEIIRNLSCLVRDSVTIAQGDKVLFDGNEFEVDRVEKVGELDNTTILQRCILHGI
jgi:hypothetical protein